MREIGMLFSTSMIQAIQDDRKTQTRRIIKPQPSRDAELFGICTSSTDSRDVGKIGFGTCGRVTSYVMPPCQPGDVIWCRETWNTTDDCNLFPPWPSTGAHYMYLADAPESEASKQAKWRPSLHMPRKAARLFLTVKDIYPEWLQNITEKDAKAEGLDSVSVFKIPEAGWLSIEDNGYTECFAALWDSIYADPKPVKRFGVITHYESYPWENIQAIREHRGKPWHVYGNPWIWVYRLERKA